MQKRIRKFKSFQREEEPEPYVHSYEPYTYNPQTDWIKKISIDEPSFSYDRGILLKLFPGLDFDKLKTCVVSRVGGYGVTMGKEYEVVRMRDGYIYIFDDKAELNYPKEPNDYPDNWFKSPFKKYDFEVYAMNRGRTSGMTPDKLYRLLGETSTGYEIIDDTGKRQNYSKFHFGFPEKK